MTLEQRVEALEKRNFKAKKAADKKAAESDISNGSVQKIVLKS